MYGGLGKLWDLAAEDKGKASSLSDNILTLGCVTWRHGLGKQLHGSISFMCFRKISSFERDWK